MSATICDSWSRSFNAISCMTSLSDKSALSFASSPAASSAAAWSSLTCCACRPNSPNKSCLKCLSLEASIDESFEPDFSTSDEYKNGGVESITRGAVQRKLAWLRDRLALCFYPHVPLSKRLAVRVYGYRSDHSSAARRSYFHSRVALLHCRACRRVRLHRGNGPVWHGAGRDEAHGPDAEHYRRANRLYSLLSRRIFFVAHILAVRSNFNSGGLYRRRSHFAGTDLQISRGDSAALQRCPLVLERW